MRFPRFHIRTLLIAVAVVALPLGLWQRSVNFRACAKYHRDQEVLYSAESGLRCSILVDEALITFDKTASGTWEFHPVSEEAAQRLAQRNKRAAAHRRWCEQLELYHGRLAREYARASTRPWLFVRAGEPPARP